MERQREMKAIHAELLGTIIPAQRSTDDHVPLTMSDEAVLMRARAARNGWRFDRLWAGDWQGAGYSSQSEADLSLCGALSFWCEGDTAAIGRLFRRSGLMRDKWDSHRGGQTYGDITIAHAISTGRTHSVGRIVRVHVEVGA